MDTALGYQLRSQISSEGKLRIYLECTKVRQPRSDEVLVKIEAAPVNPSDLSILLGYADLRTLQSHGEGFDRVIMADIPPGALSIQAQRLGKPLQPGNEGVGVVIAVGENVPHLMGRRVSAFGGGMYGEYRLLKSADCLVLGEDVSAREGASAFINPLTVLTIIETMKREGYTALVHTAAASNLGQMLCKVCLEDGIPLVNIVRRADQAEMLRSLGATHICDSSAPDFEAQLTHALKQTNATLAFDAIGGGELANRILVSMEKVQGAMMDRYSPYGSPCRKQVYIYGGLDRSATTIGRSYGMGWNIGGWLFSWVFDALPPETREHMKARVAANLKTTFSSRYSAEVTLQDMLDPEVIRGFVRMGTGEKMLVNIGL